MRETKILIRPLMRARPGHLSLYYGIERSVPAAGVRARTYKEFNIWWNNTSKYFLTEVEPKFITKLKIDTKSKRNIVRLLPVHCRHK